MALVALAGSLAGPVASASASTWHLAEGRDKYIRFPQPRHCLPERRLWIGGDFPGGHKPMLQVTRLRSERTGGALRLPNLPVYSAYGNRNYIWGSALGGG